MTIDKTQDIYEQDRLDTAEFPVPQRYTRIWKAILGNDPPVSRQAALDRVNGFNSSTLKPFPNQFAFIGGNKNLRILMS